VEGWKENGLSTAKRGVDKEKDVKDSCVGIKRVEKLMPWVFLNKGKEGILKGQILGPSSGLRSWGSLKDKMNPKVFS